MRRSERIARLRLQREDEIELVITLQDMGEAKPGEKTSYGVATPGEEARRKGAVRARQRAVPSVVDATSRNC
jgi:hypothetical protein